MLNEDFEFYDRDALLYRLHDSLENSNKSVVFVIGAPMTAPVGTGRGVGDVNAVVELVRAEFAAKPRQLSKLDAELAQSPNAYQAAFNFLAGRAGQDACNRIIKTAVANALIPSGAADWGDSIARLNEDQLSALDTDNSVWHLSPGIEALGALIARYPQRFGKLVITSNFDPLTEVAITRDGGTAWRTSLSSDGSLFQSTANGCQVIHIHGFWHGTDTLHTSRQLLLTRPTLKNDLLTALHDKIVVVMAYGGWPDIFTTALGGVVSNENLLPEVLWTFYDDQPSISEHTYRSIKPGIDRNRVSLYKGIDCHTFLPELLSLWGEREVTHNGDKAAAEIGSPRKIEAIRHDRSRLFKLAPLECDRPPSIGAWVGRENELRALETSSASTVIITGMGGEGKSTLASHYISTLADREGGYRLWDWRDCKEQSDRIRTQIVEIISRFSNNRISSADLQDADDAELVEVLIDQVHSANAVIVFDNVDSYVDLENHLFTGILDLLIQRMSLSGSNSRLIVTCRPDVVYQSPAIISFAISGLSSDEALELFDKRIPNHKISRSDIFEAHAVTKGHAFWLDLLAVQIFKVPGTTLRSLLTDLRRGRDDAPDVLSSIWDKLAGREKTLLRFMAETVRPETESQIQKFASPQLNFKNFNRALKALIALNLIVVKAEDNAPDLYDLHPLVRRFVHTKYVPSERQGFIRVVINQYELLIGALEALLGIHMPYAMLERWSQKAELEVSAGYYDQAFETLVKIEDAFIGGGHVQEYVRVARTLFEAIEWETAPTQYRRFDHLVTLVSSLLIQLGENDASDSLLDRYEQTIPQKTARYIKFCDAKGYSYWLRGDFERAVSWGEKGVTLKKETNVDTDFDCAHTLALAQRDSGNHQDALAHFLGEHTVDQLTDVRSGVATNGPQCGNVGRCLQLMGRMDEALACYRRSMRFLEKDQTSHSLGNRAYARRWIGEIYARLGDTDRAEAFFLDAINVLGSSAPIRVRDLYREIEAIRPSSKVMHEGKATQIVQRWLADS